MDINVSDEHKASIFKATLNREAVYFSETFNRPTSRHSVTAQKSNTDIFTAETVRKNQLASDKLMPLGGSKKPVDNPGDDEECKNTRSVRVSGGKMERIASHQLAVYYSS